MLTAGILALLVTIVTAVTLVTDKEFVRGHFYCGWSENNVDEKEK